MKFTWFNLMPWPHLPDDFREKYRSVWVDIPSDLFDPLEGNRVFYFILQFHVVPAISSLFNIISLSFLIPKQDLISQSASLL